MAELLDARGVVIEPGDKVIYGFGVGSHSIALAEGEVLTEELECTCRNDYNDHNTRAQRLACPRPIRGVYLTPSGRIRVRIVRRSYSRGTKPTVDVMPDRVVALKRIEFWHEGYDRENIVLPDSPLPTQADANAIERRRLIDVYRERLTDDTHPSWANSLEEYHHWCRERISELESEEAEG